MKLESLYPQAQTLPIKDGAGQPTDIKFKVVGQDSKQYHDAMKKTTKDLFGKVYEEHPEAFARARAEHVASYIVGWEGIEGSDGSAMPYTPAKAIELMLIPELTFIREQVEEFALKRAEFFRKGPKPA